MSIGQLRDQSSQIVQLAETVLSEIAADDAKNEDTNEVTDKKSPKKTSDGVPVLVNKEKK